jgi:hypothetical protein
VLALFATTMSVPVAAVGATKTSTFTATISPTQVTVGDAPSYSLRFTLGTSSSNSLGSVQVVVPAAFTGVQPGTTTTPGGWVYSLPTCSSDSPTGCGAPGTTLVQVSTPNSNGAQKVGPGQSLTINLTATAAAKGTTTWNVQAKNSAAWSTGQLLSLQGGSPQVTVYGAPAKLVFSTPPPTTLVAGTTFDAAVQLLDADNVLTPSTAQVTLSGPSLGGTTTVAAVAGTASFSGLTLTKAGTITVSASSGTLPSISSDVLVTPARPAKLVVTGPSGSVTAGGTLGVGVLVTDAYDNPVDPQVQVDLSVDGTAVASQTTVAGSTSFSVTAPTAAGSHSLTVSSSGLSRTIGFTVAAAQPERLSIDRVSDEAQIGLLSKNAPFDVVVTARDHFGNPATYTGTTTLQTAGGNGTLAGTTSASFDNQSTVTVAGATYTGYGNGISLTASAPGLNSATTSINVSLFATVQNSAPGQNTTVTSSDCTDATPSVPVCSSVILPNGASGPIVLSEAACNPFTPCLTGSQNQALLVDTTAALSGLYTRNKPATLQLRCDKTLCGGASANGFPILFKPTGGTDFLTAPACPSKGRIGPDQTFCQDFVQDHRDNAGDLVAYVLFLDDLKSTFR